ncbi:serum response factor-binding protein 1 [Chelonus insularis]|uniref:serum response factor-binding protein 1 n=1 Tax=Chelonus insularis TaxID=460826 RepID=UPI001588F20D|nr:serum response factor-binding protein 1-like [Chelonus insularis]
MEYDNTKKIAINNHIVSLRHAVRKARVGVIWKLSKEIKHLKSRQHGDEKIIKKCHRKAEKFIKEVHLLKKIKDDEVTRFAIMNFEILQDTSSDKKIDLKTEAIRRLASHKALKSKIEELRKTYPDYQIYLQSKNSNLSVSSNVKDKTKLEPTINNEWEVQDVSDVTTEVEKTNDSTEKISNESMDTNESITEEASESINKSDTVIRKKSSTKNKDKKSPKCIIDSFKDDTSDKLCKDKTVKIISELAEVKKLHITDNSIKPEEVVKQNFILNSNSNQDEGNEVNSNKIQVNREIDSFFLTGNNNENYMSIAVPESQTSNDERRWNDNTDKFNHKKKHFITNIREQDKRNNRFNINENTNRRNRRDKQQIKSVSTDKAELHPSWAARKKQQDIMKVAFQGKKIIFSDD